jgi:hypothetical protein
MLELHILGEVYVGKFSKGITCNSVIGEILNQVLI